MNTQAVLPACEQSTLCSNQHTAQDNKCHLSDVHAKQ